MTSLIVSLAILLNLCAPAVAQTVAALAGGPLALEMCSASKPAPADAPAHGAKHCMLCALHTGADAPPPATAGLLTVLAGHDQYPAPRTATTPRQPRWTAALPRAPPAAA